MIDYIRGVLTVREVGYVVVETHGVGYGINIPLSTFERLPAVGAEAMLLIHYYVREDGHKLFGFLSGDERTIFRQLIGISKIGPKVAINILSGVSTTDLVQSIGRGDPLRLQKIPGVGAKTAQRLVMELRGKLGTTSKGGSGISAEPSIAHNGILPLRDEVFAAMVSLGYNEKQVGLALERIGPSMQESDPVEAWIRKTLQVI